MDRLGMGKEHFSNAPGEPAIRMHRGMGQKHCPGRDTRIKTATAESGLNRRGRVEASLRAQKDADGTGAIPGVSN